MDSELGGDPDGRDAWRPGPLLRWAGLGCMVAIALAAVLILVLTLLTIAGLAV
jgi:hypothetical protein